MTTTPREVRVRPEFAGLYPELAPGVWVGAAELAELIVQRASAARRMSIHRRTLDPDHFEFRGGEPDRRAPGARTRRTDRLT